MVQAVKGVPWNLTGADNSQDIIFEHRPDDQPTHMPVPENPVPIPRRVRITKADVEEHGYTGGCGGCEAARSGIFHQGHTEACRNRLIEALRSIESGQTRIGAAVERLFEHIGKSGPQPQDASVTLPTGIAPKGGQNPTESTS